MSPQLILLLMLCCAMASAENAVLDESMSELPEFSPDGANGWVGGRRQDGDVLAVREKVRVQLSATSNGVLYIALCGEQCTSFVILGVADEEIHYQVRSTTPANSIAAEGTLLRDFTGPRCGFTPGTKYEFAVVRKPEEMMVWLEGHPQNAQVFRISNDQDKLRVESDTGPWQFMGPLDGKVSAASTLLSPALPVLTGSRLCVDLDYQTRRKGGVQLFAMLESGLNVTLWKVFHPQLLWRTGRDQVLVPHPEGGASWRLGLTCPDCAVRKIGPCSATATQAAFSSLRRAQSLAEPGVCSNGGRWLGAGGCACPPGFAGPSCELGCGPGRRGAGCSERCGRGELLCVAGLGCLCAAGYGGDTCDTPCLEGRYGASCLQRCGHCKGGAACDPYTGQCRRGCSQGYSGSACKDELSHLVDGPDITSVEDKVIRGSLQITKENTFGKGEVQYVRIDYRESANGDWITFSTLQLVRDTELPFAIDSLLQGTQYDVRALLLDSELNAFRPDVTPYTRVQTSEHRPVSDLKAIETHARSMEVSWESASNDTEYHIRYTCVGQLACPLEQYGSPGWLVEKKHNNRSTVLSQLQPAAIYLVQVAAGEAVWDSVLVRTKADASQALAELPPDPVSVTNSSALIHWLPPSTCSRLYGPVRDYPWELVEASAPAAVLRSNRTARPQLSLQDLRPYTNYTLRVHVANPLGHNASVFLPINFTTLPSLPSAPRDLVAYRWSHESVWLSWKSPELPGGELVRYDVSAATSSHQVAQQAAAGAECSAWPGRVCHALHGLLPEAKYTFTVRAVNRYSDQPGQPATVTAGTRIGLQEKASPAPVDLNVVGTNGTSVTIQWRLPLVIGPDFGHFVLDAQNVSFPPGEEADATNSKSSTGQIEVSDPEERPEYRYTLTNLRPNSTYTVAVKLGHMGAKAEVLAETKEL